MLKSVDRKLQNNIYFFIPFCLSVFMSFLNDTSFPSNIFWFHHLELLVYFSCFIIFVIKICSLQVTYKYFILSFFSLIVSILISIHSKDPSFPVVVSMIFASRKILWTKTVQYFFRTGIFACFSILLLFFLHVLPNTQYVKEFSIRNTFGFGYPLTLSGFSLVLCVAFCIYHYQRITWIDLIIIFFISLFVYKLTFSQMDFVCSIILIVIVGLFKINHRIFSYTLFSWGWLSLIIMTFLTFYWAITYNPIDSFYIKLNKMLEKRLFMSNYALSNIHLSFLGHFIQENSTNTPLGTDQTNFLSTFYVDQSMIKILLEYGIITFIFIIVSYSYRMFNLHQKHFDYFVMLFLIIVVRSFTDDSFIKMCYNPFLVIIFTSLANVYIYKERFKHD